MFCEMGGKRLLSHLGLAPSVVRSLEESSFIYDEDVKGLTPSELMEAVGITLDESCEVLRLSENEPQQCFTLLDMIETSPSCSTITTLSSDFDDMLGGGISVAAVTEIAGTPGIGKTQLCLQLSINVQFPENLGGLGGEAVIIDTEGSVNPVRIKEMAEYAVSHYNQLSQKNEQFHLENILSKIHYYRCLKQLTVVACIKQLPELLKKYPAIKFIAIDSLAFHLRHDVPDFRIRAGLLASVTQDLIQLATKYNLAVLVTNQMTTRVIGGSTEQSKGQGELVPALGESWAHCPTMRVVCRWINDVRTAKLIKAPHKANNIGKYQVTAAGIRDIEASPVSKITDQSCNNTGPSTKRKRDE